MRAEEVGRGGRGIAVRERQIQSREIAENCGKIAVPSPNLHQGASSLKERHFCTGDTQGTNKHARWTSKTQLPKNFGKMADNCKKSQPPPPLMALGQGHCLWPGVNGPDNSECPVSGWPCDGADGRMVFPGLDCVEDLERG